MTRRFAQNVRAMAYKRARGLTPLDSNARPASAPMGLRQRKLCAQEGCPERHLRGSDYCFAHDDGLRPRGRRAD